MKIPITVVNGHVAYDKVQDNIFALFQIVKHVAIYSLHVGHMYGVW